MHITRSVLLAQPLQPMVPQCFCYCFIYCHCLDYWFSVYRCLAYSFGRTHLTPTSRGRNTLAKSQEVKFRICRNLSNGVCQSLRYNVLGTDNCVLFWRFPVGLWKNFTDETKDKRWNSNIFVKNINCEYALMEFRCQTLYETNFDAIRHSTDHGKQTNCSKALSSAARAMRKSVLPWKFALFVMARFSDTFPYHSEGT